MTKRCSKCGILKDDFCFPVAPSGRLAKLCHSCVDVDERVQHEHDYHADKVRKEMKKYIGGWQRVEDKAKLVKEHGLSYGKYQAMVRRCKDGNSQL